MLLAPATFIVPMPSLPFALLFNFVQQKTSQLNSDRSQQMFDNVWRSMYVVIDRTMFITYMHLLHMDELSSLPQTRLCHEGKCSVCRWNRR